MTNVDSGGKYPVESAYSDTKYVFRHAATMFAVAGY